MIAAMAKSTTLRPVLMPDLHSMTVIAKFTTLATAQKVVAKLALIVVTVKSTMHEFALALVIILTLAMERSTMREDAQAMLPTAMAVVRALLSIVAMEKYTTLRLVLMPDLHSMTATVKFTTLATVQKAVAKLALIVVTVKSTTHEFVLVLVTVLMPVMARFTTLTDVLEVSKAKEMNSSRDECFE